MTFTRLPDLALRSLGGAVVAASDELFAVKENLLGTGRPDFQAHTFDRNGQVYDGWETRRRRAGGHDWAIVRLATSGIIAGIVVDTAHFKGNFPPYCSVEATCATGYPSPAELEATAWDTIVDRAPLGGDAEHLFEVASDRRYTHVRLNIFPDGGVARLRVHGEPLPDPAFTEDAPLDLAATLNGGRIVAASNEFYSAPNNMLQPGLAAVTGEGWETARRRDDGNDWVLVRLAGHSEIRVAELDATHFKGNAPGQARLLGIDTSKHALDDEDGWFELLPLTRTQPDTVHRYRLEASAPVTHVRLDVYPDGGLARLRLYGRLTAAGATELREKWELAN